MRHAATIRTGVFMTMVGFGMAGAALLAQPAAGQARGDTAVAQTRIEAQARTEAQLTAALEGQGYDIEKVRRSLLGRLIVTARNADHRREVVMSRATGEILSDRIVGVFAEARSGGNAGGDGKGNGSGNSNGNAAATVTIDGDTRVEGGNENAGASVTVEVETGGNGNSGGNGVGAEASGGIGGGVGVGN